MHIIINFCFLTVELDDEVNLDIICYTNIRFSTYMYIRGGRGKSIPPVLSVTMLQNLVRSSQNFQHMMHSQHIHLCMHLFPPLLLSPEAVIFKMAITPLKRLGMTWLSLSGQVFLWFWGGLFSSLFLFCAVFF